MIRTITTVLATTAIATALAGTPAQADATRLPHFVACATEDSKACYWDATTRSNHGGHSFYAKPTPKGWTTISPQLATDLATWGDATDRATRNWAICLQHIGDTTVIACPDGHVERS